MMHRGIGKMLICLVVALCLPAPTKATGFEEIAQALGHRSKGWWSAHGVLRTRQTLLYNLDLDHGLTPSGQSLYPVPLNDPDAQTLSAVDMRLRTDLAFRTPGGGMALNIRVDVLDNLRLGGAPEGHPTATGTQSVPQAAFRIKRAYGMALTPFGFLAAGRMGSHFGLGMLTHGGDCPDCDSGDAADRLAFVTPLFGHFWAVAYDFSATGPSSARKSGAPGIDLEPTDNVNTVTVAFMKTHTKEARKRRLRADRSSVEYGALVSHRWQMQDIPADYLPTVQSITIDPAQVVERGFTATVVDAWSRVATPWMRLEAEVAVLTSTIEQPSLIPGVSLHDPLESLQIGGAFESDFGPWNGELRGGLDAGYASGDPSPGFGGSFAGPTERSPAAGDLNGHQAAHPHDLRIDNFRFHSDYRVDRILWREIVGTVTDAIYIRPHLDWQIAEIGPGILTSRLAVVASFAAQANSAPGGESALGVEIDPSLAYLSRDGFGLALDYAVLFPLAGLDNKLLGLAAQPAQLLRLRIGFGF